MNGPAVRRREVYEVEMTVAYGSRLGVARGDVDRIIRFWADWSRTRTEGASWETIRRSVAAFASGAWTP